MLEVWERLPDVKAAHRMHIKKRILTFIDPSINLNIPAEGYALRI